VGLPALLHKNLVVSYTSEILFFCSVLVHMIGDTSAPFSDLAGDSGGSADGAVAARQAVAAERERRGVLPPEGGEGLL